MNDDINRDRRYPSDDGSGPGNEFHPSVEALSEYLDNPGDLPTAEREAIEGHLPGCPECQNVLADLRLVVRTLGSLPEREVPHSFALTPDMLEPAKTPAHPAPVVLQESAQWHARHASKVRWATAVAAALFVFVISADLLTNGLSVTGTDDAADDIVAVRQADDSDADTEAYSQEEPAEEAAPSGALEESESTEDPPAADAMPQQESEEEQPESEEVPEEEAGSGDEEVPATESADAFTAQDDGEVEEEEDDDASSLRTEPGEMSDEPQSEVTAQEDSSQMRWRIVEVTLALVLALLLAVMIGLPKQRGSRRR